MCTKLLPSRPTLFNPMDCSPPGSSVCGPLQARILEWVAISFSIHYIIVFNFYIFGILHTKDNLKKINTLVFFFFFSKEAVVWNNSWLFFFFLEWEFYGVFCDDRRHRVLGLRRLGNATCCLMTLKRKRTSSNVQWSHHNKRTPGTLNPQLMQNARET